MSRDFMHAGEIKEIVREAYTAIDSSTEAVARKLYWRRSCAGAAIGDPSRFRRREPPARGRDRTRRDDPRSGLGGGIDRSAAVRQVRPDA